MNFPFDLIILHIYLQYENINITYEFKNNSNVKILQIKIQRKIYTDGIKGENKLIEM